MVGAALVSPVDYIVPTSDGHGSWLVVAGGGTFSFGDARSLGSMGGRVLNAPVAVEHATTANDGAYLFIASDCGSFALDAPYLGTG